MHSFEKLGVFYLGRVHEPQDGAASGAPVLYDSRDLTTHAVCVGMTGSGKTGLCLALLEEAALDGIPAIAIDPKGDLGNLLLTFPDLKTADFRPWVDESEAVRLGISPDELASRTAATWKHGLEEWGEDGARIERLRAAADFAVYTPGSSAGLSLTVLRSFDPPPAAISDGDALRERIAATVAGVLALLAIEADPVNSRETILLGAILQEAWQSGRRLDLPSLIRQVQNPPQQRIGVMDMESFYPAKDRFALAMSLNNLLASPGFSAWREGEPLDVARLLWTPQGKPRVSVISIAHLSDPERMFVVTLLLNEIVAWMRSQPGSSSLRAILYMDEVFGYFPPVANPPSKAPLLTLMKQARAAGLGVVLATQNPVDLDYKGLSNAGTWILGRLQTERDKSRVLEGLEGASSAAGATFDRQAMESTLAGLKSRVFLLNNVHEDAPVVFESRWCLSYLRGPLTRAQIQTLMASRKPPAPAAQACVDASAPAFVSTIGTATPAAARPVLPPGLRDTFLAWRGGPSESTRLLYRPALLGTAHIHFMQAPSGERLRQEVCLLAPLRDPLPEDPWEAAESLDREPDLEDAPRSGAALEALPPAASRLKNYDSWKKALSESLYRNRALTLFTCPLLRQTSRLGESEGDFRVRLGQQLREERDRSVEALRTRHAAKMASIQDRLRRAQQRVESEQSQYDAQKVQTAISAGAAILGAFFGRKTLSLGTLGRSTTAARSVGRTAREREDVTRAAESAQQLQEDLARLQAELEAQISDIQQRADSSALLIESTALRPKKSDIQVGRVVLVWTPWETTPGGGTERRF
ncbi:MAG TPA: DUF87 domain-containing protein [Candidatus Polarisedimenticolia bacterium]|nr:DUF87 domain-containing protein [Candidatus Polarisedimenticolia bacterium]